jgi:hypothetical protein
MRKFMSVIDTAVDAIEEAVFCADLRISPYAIVDD